MLACTFPGKILSLKLRWGNFSEKPPSYILGCGRDVMDGEGQRPQGELWDRGLPCCNAEFDYSAHPDHWPEPCSPGEGPGQRDDQGSGKGGPHIPRGTKGPQSKTPLREGNPHSEEVSCARCKAYNWSRPVCRSCGTPFFQRSSRLQPLLTPTCHAKMSSAVHDSSSPKTNATTTPTSWALENVFLETSASSQLRSCD